MIHRYSRAELFIKQKDAPSRKGVAGNTGRTMPATPRASRIKPPRINRSFETLIIPPSIIPPVMHSMTGGKV
jgi:hypothetical protein